MKMKGKKWIAALLALVMAIAPLTGCADNTEDIMGMVGETPIYRWYYNAYLISQLEAYLVQTGVNLTLPEKKEELKTYKQYRLNDLVGEFALREEARKQGFDTLTPEQEREVDLQYQEYYNNAMAGFIDQYGADESGRRQAEQAYIDLLKRSTLTPERLRKNFRDQYVLNLFMQSVAAQEAISDEEVRAYYDAHKESEKTSCESDATWFGKNVTDYSIYIPEGYVDTARITKKMTNAQVNRLKEASTKQATAQINYMQEVSANGEGTTAAKNLLEALNSATAAFDSLLESVYQELAAEMQPIRDEVAAGADFIKTMELKSDDVRRISYYVSKESDHVDETYRDAALALQNEGDISEVVRLQDGVCIIKLMEKLTPGVRTYEETAEAIRKQLQLTRSIGLQLDLMDEYAEKAQEAGIVTLYTDKL